MSTSLLPDSVLQKYSSDDIQQAIAHLTDTERRHLHAALKKKEQAGIVARCQERKVSHHAGPMYWLREHTKTENYHATEQGLPSVAPFPYLPHGVSYPLNAGGQPDWHGLNPLEHDEPDYLDIVMQQLLESRDNGTPLYIPKTREMMTSWLVVGYIAWCCQFFPNTQAVSQSEKDEKAQGLIKYANILYGNQEPWMKDRFPLKRGTSGTAHRIEWANGSEFISVPMGERQVASYHPTIYFNDESAHQPTFEATLNIVAPVAKQIICVSSAAASRFGELCDPALAI